MPNYFLLFTQYLYKLTPFNKVGVIIHTLVRQTKQPIKRKRQNALI
nr:MAG TPA: hypothetical protein [Caudoviricetes sp.]DAX34126.1 MAG TPA: hypothetical protein [Caudoviricetes sp.]